MKSFGNLNEVSKIQWYIFKKLCIFDFDYEFPLQMSHSTSLQLI
jgi:hypothetical protein